MSEKELQRLVERLNKDEDFRRRVEDDTHGALAEFHLSHTEQVALAANDEDALRRLAGAPIDVDFSIWKWLSKYLCSRFFCGPGGTRDWQCPRKT
ncbi:MAG TPA: hypothetical protein VK756_11630 [Solirubrobacteraceae bacterium]|jgi:hypothetical protein|nr:hypothetical protein [Solirubrobacteraceae bacterium]